MQGAQHARPPLRPRPMSAKPSSSSSSQSSSSLFSSARSLLQSQGNTSTANHQRNKGDNEDDEEEEDDDDGVLDDDDDDEDSNDDEYGEFGAAAEHERKSFQRQAMTSTTGTDSDFDYYIQRPYPCNLTLFTVCEHCKSHSTARPSSRQFRPASAPPVRAKPSFNANVPDKTHQNNSKASSRDHRAAAAVSISYLKAAAEKKKARDREFAVRFCGLYSTLLHQFPSN